MTPMHRSTRSTPPHCGYGYWAFAIYTGTLLKERPPYLVPDTVLYVMYLALDCTDAPTSASSGEGRPSALSTI